MPPLSYVKNITPRAVHLKVQPQPRNVYETRSILRVLREFGEVDSFRWLGNYQTAPAPNTIMAIFRHAESASRLIDEAPLQLDIPPRPEYTPLGIGQPRNQRVQAKSITAELANQAIKALGKSKEETGGTRTFVLNAQNSTFDHQAYLMRQANYWGFKEDVKPPRRTEIPMRIANKFMAEVTSRKSLKDLVNETRRNKPETAGQEEDNRK